MANNQGNYQQMQEDDKYSVMNSQKDNLQHRESVLSEATGQSSAISQERNAKINDQFQKKKLEFYKMYNKNPANTPKKGEKPRAKQNTAQAVSYKTQSDRQIREALEIAQQPTDEDKIDEENEEEKQEDSPGKKEKKDDKKKDDKKEKKDDKKSKSKEKKKDDKKEEKKEDKKIEKKDEKTEKKDEKTEEKKDDKKKDDKKKDDKKKDDKKEKEKPKKEEKEKKEKPEKQEKKQPTKDEPKEKTEQQQKAEDAKAEKEKKAQDAKAEKQKKAEEAKAEKEAQKQELAKKKEEDLQKKKEDIEKAKAEKAEKAALQKEEAKKQQEEKTQNMTEGQKQKQEKQKETKDQEKKQAAQMLAAKQKQKDEQREEQIRKEEELEKTDGDFNEKKDNKVKNLLAQQKKKTNKFCAKFCFTFWVSFPMIIQIGAMFAQELINVYIVGKSGDYQFIDIVAMSNILVYFICFGTAIVFNSVLETLIPHALATGKVELSGHILNRGIFLWSFLFLCMLAGICNWATILTTVLGQDAKDAQGTQNYLLHLCPAIWFWGITDAYRRFFNCFDNFWTPALTYCFFVAIHPLVCYQLITVNEMGPKGLALAMFISNFGNYFVMRCLVHCRTAMKPASFCPKWKTCCGLGTYLYYGIPQLIMFWVDTWQWQLLAFVTGWFGVTEQYTTILLLGGTMFMLIFGYALASVSATLSGKEIGCANVTGAKYYYRSVLTVSITIAVFQAICLQMYLGIAMDTITDDQNMEKTITSVYHLWIFNVFLSSIRCMLKGFLRALARQNSALFYHIFVQGAILPGAVFVLCYNMLLENQVLGAWIASTICEFLLFLAYFHIVQHSDWNEISVGIVKRLQKVAGDDVEDEEYDFQGNQNDDIEMAKQLK